MILSVFDKLTFVIYIINLSYAYILYINENQYIVFLINIRLLLVHILTFAK